MERSPESMNSKDLVVAGSESSQEGSKGQQIALIYLFCVAVLLRLWFNFATDHINAATASDASEYLRYATAISNLNWLAPQFGHEWKEFVITGPVFPFFLWLCSLATANEVNNDIDIFLIAQSIVSSLTVVFIAQIGKNLWTCKTGLIAGYLAAFYPGFIVNSGRLYSETFATSLEVAALLILTQAATEPSSGGYLHWHKLKYATLGALLVALQLTRSSMILLTGAALIFVFICSANTYRLNQVQWKKATTNVALVTAGGLMVLAPWLFFEKAAFNKLSLVVDRVGHYNLFIGTNSAIQGFLSYPYPDGRGIEQKSFLQLIEESYKKSPNRFMKLMLDKPARLYKFPWNDFRTAIGPVSMQLQVAFHQLIILLAIIGLALAIPFTPIARTQGKKEAAPQSGQALGKAAVLLMIALNLPYLAFITVPRYNLMAMPALILLAAAASSALVTLLRENKLAKAPKSLCCSAIFLFLYLRDDLRAPLSTGTRESFGLYFVQGTDLLTRSLIATSATIAFIVSLWFCLPLLTKQQNRASTARVFIVILATFLLPLCLFPQRANGRFQEGLITLSTPGDTITGQIPVDKGRSASGPTPSWFLLIDSDLGQLPNQQFDIEVNGTKVTTPAMPSLAALDDWHYLKQSSSAGNYLECAYIFDCLSRETSMSSTDLRQWFVIPLSAEQQRQIETKKSAQVSIIQKTSQPTTLFTAASQPNNKQLLPSRNIYSWEKAFYGVENDSGLTCPRYDEVVPKRKANWTAKAQGKSEELRGIDLNVRLIAVENIAAATNIELGKVNGTSSVTLSLDRNRIGDGQLIAIATSLSYPTDYTHEVRILSDSTNTKPQLQLHWLDRTGAQQMMVLPWLSKPQRKLALSIPLDLRQIDGSQFKVTCNYPDKNCQIELSSSILNGHPLRSKQELF